MIVSLEMPHREPRAIVENKPRGYLRKMLEERMKPPF
jgi:hypothetical protein